MSEQDVLDRARELLAEATPGPWSVCGGQKWTVIYTDENGAPREVLGPGSVLADAALIAAAPALIAELVVEVERLRAIKREWDILCRRIEAGDRQDRFKRERDHHRETLRKLANCGARNWEGQILREREPWLFEDNTSPDTVSGKAPDSGDSLG